MVVAGFFSVLEHPQCATILQVERTAGLPQRRPFSSVLRAGMILYVVIPRINRKVAAHQNLRAFEGQTADFANLRTRPALYYFCAV